MNMSVLALAALALGALPLASAQAMLISPTAFNVNPLSSNTAQVRFENQGGVPAKFQVEVMRWSTENGAYVYAPSRDVVANPAEFTLQPQATQVIRIGVLKKVGSDELTYRVFIRQLPLSSLTPAASTAADMQVSLNNLSNFSLPVYITPPDSTPRLSAQVRAGPGGLQLELSNDGNRHLTLRQLQAQVGSQTVDLGSVAVLGHSVLRLPLQGLDGGAATLTMLYRDAKGDEQRESVAVIR